MSKTYISASLRHEVIERAHGCCEYCRVPSQDKIIPFEIDHIISEKHLGKTISENLCLSCSLCNSCKGSDISGADPLTGLATFLFNPRLDNWDEHFVLEGVVIRPISPQGRITEMLLQLNHAERLSERRLMMKLGLYPCS